MLADFQQEEHGLFVKFTFIYPFVGIVSIHTLCGEVTHECSYLRKQVFDSLFFKLFNTKPFGLEISFLSFH